MTIPQGVSAGAATEVDYDARLNLISTTTPDSRITYANQNFCQVAGYQPEELEGQPHNIVRHPDMPKPAFAQLWQYIRAGKSWMGLVKNRCQDGGFYWVSAFVTPILNARGEVIEYQSVRSKPDRESVARAEALYADLRRNKTPRLRRLALMAGLPVLTFGSVLLQGIALWQQGLSLTGGLGLLGCGLAGAVSVYLVGRLRTLQQLAQKTYDNPLMEKVYTGRFDDFSVIELALKMRQAELRAIVGRATETSGRILTAAEQELQNSQQIESNLRQQMLATEHVSVAMDQMSSSIHEVAESAALASSITTQAQQISREGQQSVETTINSVHALHEELDNSKQVIHDLSQSSTQIEGILDVIGAIADQTNLLALNAAIEAARAGEAGRGFAVVADEVRSLAQKTQSSTGEIQQMITRLQAIAAQAVEAVERGTSLSEQCNQQAAETGHRLVQINEVLNQVTDSSRQIADAVEEQAKMNDQISHNIENINQLTVATAGSSDQSVDSTRQLVAQLEAMRRLMLQFERAI